MNDKETEKERQHTRRENPTQGGGTTQRRKRLLNPTTHPSLHSFQADDGRPAAPRARAYFLNTASYTAETPDTAVPTSTPFQPLYSAPLMRATDAGLTSPPNVTPCAYTT